MRSQGVLGNLKPSRDENLGGIPCSVVLMHDSRPSYLRRQEAGQGWEFGFGGMDAMRWPLLCCLAISAA